MKEGNPMRLRCLPITSLLALLVLAASLLVGCGDTNRVTNSVTNNFTVALNGSCSIFFFDGAIGRTERIEGRGGSTVSRGGTSFAFAPDCSSVTVSGEAAEGAVTPA
jgi:hypothetical protein